MINNVIILIMISLVLVGCKSDYLNKNKSDNSKQVETIDKNKKDAQKQVETIDKNKKDDSKQVETIIGFNEIDVSLFQRESTIIRRLKEGLNHEEKIALSLLEKVITERRLDDREYVTIHPERIFNNFLLYLDDVKLREVLTPIIETLAAQIETATALSNYEGARKNEFKQELNEKKVLYLKMLKSGVNLDSFDIMYTFFKNNSNAYQFFRLKTIIESS